MRKALFTKKSCAGTPQQNGLAERKNCHLLEVARALLFSRNVPNIYWGDIVLTTSYLINHIPFRTLNSLSLIKRLAQTFPSSKMISNLLSKIFGSIVYVHVLSKDSSKLDPRGLKCIFLGYTPHQKAYKCYHPPNKQYFVTMVVSIYEHLSYYPRTNLQGESSTQEDKPGYPLPNASKFDIDQNNYGRVIACQEFNRSLEEDAAANEELNLK